MLLQHLEYVLTVAELKSISKAAAKLYITQPSLSRVIISWEKKIGVKVFDRSVTPLGLTPAGEIVLNELRRINQIEKNLLKRLDVIKSESNRVIRLGSTPSRANSMAHTISEFIKTNDDVRIYIYEHYTKDLRAMLLKGELDFYIGAGPSTLSDFAFEPMFSEQLYLVTLLSNDSPAERAPYRVSAQQIIGGCAGKAPCVDLKMFQDEPVIGYYLDMQLYQSILHSYEMQGVTPNIVANSHNGGTALRMVQSGTGITIATSSAIKCCSFCDKLEFYRFCAPDWIIGIFTRRDKPLNDIARQFVSFLAKHD